MNIKARFTHEKVDHTKENELNLVVTMEAPKIDWEKKRQPICVLPVIDVSASMEGQKIEYAKKSVIKLIEHLAPGDFCGIVAFSQGVYPIAKPREMTQAQKEELKAKVGNLQSVSSTNFAGGMRQGLEWLNETDLDEKYILRVIMFTDGLANVGECNGRQLIPLMKKLLGRGSLSAFGYGSDCDQELLADLAREGSGNYTFVRNPDDALSAFARELGGLLSRYAQDIKVELEPCNGHEITEVVSDVDSEEDEKKVIVSIPEILSEEERHIVYEVKTSEQTKALPRALNILSIKVSYTRFEDGEKKEETKELKAKLQFVKPGEEQTEPTKEVMELVGLAKLVQAQVEAEEYATSGNFAGAQAVMGANAAYLVSHGLTSHAKYAHSARGMMSDSSSYSMSRGRLRGAAKGMTRGVEASAAVMDDMDDLGVKCYTPIQASLEESFAEGTGSPPSHSSVVISTPVPSMSGTIHAGDPNEALIEEEEEKEEQSKKKSKKKTNKKVSKKRSKRW